MFQNQTKIHENRRIASMVLYVGLHCSWTFSGLSFYLRIRIFGLLLYCYKLYPHFELGLLMNINETYIVPALEPSGWWSHSFPIHAVVSATNRCRFHLSVNVFVCLLVCAIVLS